MKKLRFIGLLALALALSMAFYACKSDSDDEGGGSEDSFSVTGVIAGMDVEAIISKSSKAAYSIATGDYYIIRFIEGGEVISRGRIEWEDPNVRFIPDDGSDPFYGFFNAGTIVIKDVPYDGKFWPIGQTAPQQKGQFGNLTTTAPWSTYTKAQAVVQNAYNAYFEAYYQDFLIEEAILQNKDITEQSVKDAAATKAAAKTKLEKEVIDAIAAFEDAIEEKIQVEDIAKNWVKDKTGIAAIHPQDLPEDSQDGTTHLYFIKSELSTGNFGVDTGASGWDFTEPSTYSGTAISTVTISYEYGDDGDGNPIGTVDYDVQMVPVALVKISWAANTAGILRFTDGTDEGVGYIHTATSAAAEYEIICMIDAVSGTDFRIDECATITFKRGSIVSAVTSAAVPSSMTVEYGTTPAAGTAYTAPVTLNSAIYYVTVDP